MKRITQMLGLAMRAGCVVTGEERVVQKIRSGQAKLVLIANDAGFHTKKKLTDKTNYYDVPLLNYFDRRTLGQALGKGERVTVAVTDTGFAAQLLKLSQLYSGGGACD